MNTCSQAMSKPHALNNMFKNVTICLLAASFLAACAKEKYVAKPINPQQTSAKILAKDPLSTDFKAYQRADCQCAVSPHKIRRRQSAIGFS
jgi:hypothetical protein